MSKLERVIFFVYWPFTKRDVERFGLQLLRANGFTVEVWDFSQALAPADSVQAFKPDLTVDHGIRTIGCIADGVARIASIPANTFVVMVNLLGYPLSAVRVCRAVSQRQIPYGVFHGAPFPSDGMKKTLPETLKRLIRVTPTVVLRNLAMRCPARLLGMQPATMMMVAGEGAFFPRFPTGPETEILPIHTFDYDLYLQELGRPCPENGRLAVFLDDYVPFHQDFALTKTTPFYQADEYYPMLCRFFNRLEKEFDLEVVVAAHPKSNYEKHPDYYQGRKVIKDRTVQLVREARVILTFFSTAINFAIMFNKPVMLLTTDRYESIAVTSRDIVCLSRLLGKRPVNVSQDAKIDLQSELCVRPQYYEEYKRRYIKKPGTVEEPIWQIVARRLKSLDC